MREKRSLIPDKTDGGGVGSAAFMHMLARVFLVAAVGTLLITTAYYAMETRKHADELDDRLWRLEAPPAPYAAINTTVYGDGLNAGWPAVYAARHTAAGPVANRYTSTGLATIQVMQERIYAEHSAVRGDTVMWCGLNNWMFTHEYTPAVNPSTGFALALPNAFNATTVAYVDSPAAVQPSARLRAHVMGLLSTAVFTILHRGVDVRTTDNGTDGLTLSGEWLNSTTFGTNGVVTTNTTDASVTLATTKRYAWLHFVFSGSNCADPRVRWTWDGAAETTGDGVRLMNPKATGAYPFELAFDRGVDAIGTAATLVATSVRGTPVAGGKCETTLLGWATYDTPPTTRATTVGPYQPAYVNTRFHGGSYMAAAVSTLMRQGVSSLRSALGVDLRYVEPPAPLTSDFDAAATTLYPNSFYNRRVADAIASVALAPRGGAPIA